MRSSALPLASEHSQTRRRVQSEAGGSGPAKLVRMSAKTALITGIAGQDGIYLARFLRAKGYRVVGTSAPASASLTRLGTYLDGVEIDRVDLRDGVAMQD